MLLLIYRTGLRRSATRAVYKVLRGGEIDEFCRFFSSWNTYASAHSLAYYAALENECVKLRGPGLAPGSPGNLYGSGFIRLLRHLGKQSIKLRGFGGLHPILSGDSSLSESFLIKNYKLSDDDSPIPYRRAPLFIDFSHRKVNRLA